MQILLTEEELREGVAKMATSISVLMADMIRLLEMPLRVGVLQARSYQGATTTRGPLIINDELMPDIEGREVLLLDDIFDTGRTLKEVEARIRRFSPATVRSAVLLYKEGRQEVEMVPDFIGFKIPDEFVVGYGLDYEDAYRNLPYLAVLEEEDLQST